MEELWRAGFNRDAEASIAQPIAYMPTLRLLLQEKVEGLKAQEVFQHVDERSQVAAAERCAMAGPAPCIRPAFGPASAD